MDDQSKLKIITVELVDDKPIYLIWQPDAEQPERVPAAEAHKKYEKELLKWYESKFRWQPLSTKRKK